MRPVNDNFLEVTVVNTSSKTVTIQPQGYHNFLVPWGPSAPELGNLDNRPWTTGQSKQNHSPVSSLFVTNAATGEMVHRHHDISICHLMALKAELRAKIDDLVNLTPGVYLLT
jgi:hypothetical protein